MQEKFYAIRGIWAEVPPFWTLFAKNKGDKLTGTENTIKNFAYDAK